MRFAYEKYEQLLQNDRVGKDRYETATRIGNMFNVDPSFFIYCDDYGLEVALEYFMHLEQRAERAMHDKMIKIFREEEESKND